MTTHMGRDRPGDPGPVRHTLHDSLDRTGGAGEGVVEDEVRLEESAESVREGHDPELRPFPVGAALALDPERALLPLNVLGSEVGKL